MPVIKRPVVLFRHLRVSIAEKLNAELDCGLHVGLFREVFEGLFGDGHETDTGCWRAIMWTSPWRHVLAVCSFINSEHTGAKAPVHKLGRINSNPTAWPRRSELPQLMMVE